MIFAFSLHVVPSAHQILAVSTLANMVIVRTHLAAVSAHGATYGNVQQL